jgi:hypothetical protein
MDDLAPLENEFLAGVSRVRDGTLMCLLDSHPGQAATLPCPAPRIRV